jgi:hypothetical protein
VVIDRTIKKRQEPGPAFSKWSALVKLATDFYWSKTETLCQQLMRNQPSRRSAG